jgi:hypothetical protein
VIEINEGVGWPDLVPQLIPRDDLARTFQQDSENLEWLILQPIALSALFAQFSRLLVEFETREANNGTRRSGLLHARPPRTAMRV